MVVCVVIWCGSLCYIAIIRYQLECHKYNCNLSICYLTEIIMLLVVESCGHFYSQDELPGSHIYEIRYGLFLLIDRAETYLSFTTYFLRGFVYSLFIIYTWFIFYYCICVLSQLNGKNLPLILLPSMIHVQVFHVTFSDIEFICRESLICYLFPVDF